MGYDFTIKGGVRVKVKGEYPWPIAPEHCKNNADRNRTIELWPDDVLTKQDNGKYMKHTGLGCTNIVLTEEQIEPIGKDVALRLL